MDEINENRILTNVRLSQAQKFILAKLSLPESTPLTSYGQVSSGKNMVANRNVLVKLGMVIVGANEAEITETGIHAMQNENLIDDMGTLTPQGEEYAYADSIEDVEKLASQQETPPEIPQNELPGKEPEARPNPPMGLAPNEDAPLASSFESWGMISDAQTTISEKEFLKRYSIK